MSGYAGSSQTAFAPGKAVRPAAAADAGNPGADQERQVVVFQLAKETYGVEIRWVREIITVQTVTRLPGAPAFVEGVINLRGHVIPVVDLRKRFGLEASVDPRRTRIMVVEVAPHTLGLVVDAVTEVLRLPESVIEPAGNVLAGVDVAFIQGVAKLESRLIILLNLGRLLESSEVKALERVQATVESGAEEGAEGPGHGADSVPA